MTVRFMAGATAPTERPADWEALDGTLYCLSCLRKLSGQAKAESLSEQDSGADRYRADAEGRVEFELLRSADRGDTRVARACGTNVALVRKVRERLGAYPTGPV